MITWSPGCQALIAAWIAAVLSVIPSGVPFGKSCGRRSTTRGSTSRWPTRSAAVDRWSIAPGWRPPSPARRSPRSRTGRRRSGRRARSRPACRKCRVGVGAGSKSVAQRARPASHRPDRDLVRAAVVGRKAQRVELGGTAEQLELEGGCRGIAEGPEVGVIGPGRGCRRDDPREIAAVAHPVHDANRERLQSGKRTGQRQEVVDAVEPDDAAARDRQWS